MIIICKLCKLNLWRSAINQLNLLDQLASSFDISQYKSIKLNMSLHCSVAIACYVKYISKCCYSLTFRIMYVEGTSLQDSQRCSLKYVKVNRSQLGANEHPRNPNSIWLTSQRHNFVDDLGGFHFNIDHLVVSIVVQMCIQIQNIFGISCRHGKK